MIVGIDAREARGPSREQPGGAAGRSRYISELVARLPKALPEARFVLYGDSGAAPGALHPNARWRPVRARGPRWHLEVARAARREADVYLSLSPLTSSLLDRYVQSVFDLIAFRGGDLSPRRSRRVERLTLPRAVRRARGVVAISQATAADLARLVPESGGKTTVTPLAADARFRPDPPAAERERVRAALGLPAAYVLAAGTIEPRKNHVRLARAHAALPDDLRRAHPLVVAGRPGWDYDAILAELRRASDPPVRVLDFVSDGDLTTLYAGASLFCYPSLYEGFGLPVLEAMQAGAPVVTSNVSSLPEVGGDAVRYVDPHDEADLARALEELLAEEQGRRALRAAGLERARAFSWDETARLTASALRAATDRA